MGLTASQVTDKWVRNLSQSGEAYKQGVQNVSTSPTELALRQKDRMVQNLQAAVTSGKYEKGCRKVDLNSWQQAAINKGSSRLTGGAAAARSKVEAFNAAWQPIMQQVKEQVRSMPRGTEADAIERIKVVMNAGKRFAGKPA